MWEANKRGQAPHVLHLFLFVHFLTLKIWSLAPAFLFEYGTFGHEAATRQSQGNPGTTYDAVKVMGSDWMT
ncbi:hypothetical protein KDH_77250 [Dictyobacter sp. S3.2.2.5]|uniref:Uncharacterized protein n=1 Tax=Dictyobacter halimunensis TaxID=3026934 RepID=A0ABQ6G7X1_9CHLR|nr:hypothetical protein KDH_77250 [Dictyobacter sp. S3.2.2.5]